MPGYMRVSVLALLLALPVIPAGTALAEDNARAEAERARQGKVQREKNKEFNRDILYRQVVGPDVLPLGPFSVSFYKNGRLVEHRIRVALQMVDVEAKTRLESFQPQLSGIVYPLSLRLFENGRPTRDDLELFKTDVRKQVMHRFRDSLKDVFIEAVF